MTQKNTRQFQELCEKALLGMTGKRVKVRLQRPVVKTYDGHLVNIGGQLTVDIDPELNDDMFLFVITHEAGHVASNHAGRITTKDYLFVPPGSTALTPAEERDRNQSPRVREHEDTAEARADDFRVWARSHEQEYPADSELKRKLLALANYGRRPAPTKSEVETWMQEQAAIADRFKTMVRSGKR